MGARTAKVLPSQYSEEPFKKNERKNPHCFVLKRTTKIRLFPAMCGGSNFNPHFCPPHTAAQYPKAKWKEECSKERN